MARVAKRVPGGMEGDIADENAEEGKEEEGSGRSSG